MGKKRLAFTFGGAKNPDAGFRETIVSSFSGYEFSLALAMPAAVSLRWLDENGAEAPNPGTCSASGAALDFRSPMADLIMLEKACTMEVTW
jgi:hypothetical protein